MAGTSVFVLRFLLRLLVFWSGVAPHLQLFVRQQTLQKTQDGPFASPCRGFGFQVLPSERQEDACCWTVRCESCVSLCCSHFLGLSFPSASGPKTLPLSRHKLKIQAAGGSNLRHNTTNSSSSECLFWLALPAHTQTSPPSPNPRSWSCPVCSLQSGCLRKSSELQRLSKRFGGP